jgi:hypothetical protein
VPHFKKKVLDMMKLFTVCMTVFFMFAISACSDDVDVQTTGDGQLDASAVEADVNDSDAVATDTLSEDDVEALDAVAGEVEAVGDVTSTDTTGDDIVNVENDVEQIQEDPTEDPNDDSSFYEFPAWEIPPSDDDGNQ